MTSFPSVQSGSHDLIVSLPLHYDVSWAGKSELPGTDLCFGLEDGSLIFTDIDGANVVNRLNNASPSGEAINGVAFIQNYMSVSTRNEVMQWTLNAKSSAKMLGAEIPTGAHGIVAGPNGYFFAPVGLAGIMYFAPTSNAKQDVTVSGPTSDRIYIYRLCCQPTPNDTVIIACAARRGGVAAMKFHPEIKKHHLSTFTFDNLDVVDVCSSPIADARSVVAIAKNGTLIYFRDVLTDRKPLTATYNTIAGAAYRVLVVHDYIFVLTSEGLFVVANLIDHFTNRVAGNPPVRILPIPMEAVDMNVVDDRWILIVLPDKVLRFDVELLNSHNSHTNSRTSMRDESTAIMDATGTYQEIAQSSTPMPIGA